MQLSEKQIKYIIERAESSWRHNKLPESRKKEYLLTLKTYLTRGGVIENVCHKCLGTGRQEDSGAKTCDAQQECILKNFGGCERGCSYYKPLIA